MQGTVQAQSKNWCFTYFAKKDQDLQWATDRLFELAELEDTNICSVASAVETCPKTNREHLQGFLQTKRKGMPFL